MVFFTSDLHLGHDSVIGFCNRPFASVEEMDAVLINNWNKKVKNNDTVYIVGDFVWQKCVPDKYLRQLNGKKILVTGNHDHWAKKAEYFSYFEEITQYKEVSLNNHPITLCHYPMIEWKNSRKEGSSKLGYLIYGHTHNNIKQEYRLLFEKPNALNAGVDINGFSPVNFDELTENNKKFSAFALEQLKEDSKK